MAIQVRRGNYADLDKSKLVQGEPFVTLDKYDGDYYVGMAIAPNNVVRLATWDDLTDIRTDCVDARDEAVASAENAATSEENAEDYCERAETAWDNIDEAVSFLTPQVSIDFDTGELEYNGSQILFWIDQPTGNLMWNVISA